MYYPYYSLVPAIEPQCEKCMSHVQTRPLQLWSWRDQWPSHARHGRRRPQGQHQAVSQRWELRSQQNNGGDEFYYAHKCRGDEKCIEKSINFFSIKYQVEWMFFQHCDDKSILWFAIHKECWMRLAEKSSLCLKSNNGNCGDNVMLGEAVTLLFSLLGFWQEPQNWFSQTEHSAARGPGVDLSST